MDVQPPQFVKKHTDPDRGKRMLKNKNPEANFRAAPYQYNISSKKRSRGTALEKCAEAQT